MPSSAAKKPRPSASCGAKRTGPAAVNCQRIAPVAASNARTEIWAYCLMPNHVHVILTPEDEQGLRRTFADLHRRYTGFINARHGWTGHLWQGRFGSVAMDDAYLANAVR